MRILVAWSAIGERNEIPVLNRALWRIVLGFVASNALDIRMPAGQRKLSLGMRKVWRVFPRGL